MGKGAERLEKIGGSCAEGGVRWGQVRQSGEGEEICRKAGKGVCKWRVWARVGKVGRGAERWGKMEEGGKR